MDHQGEPITRGVGGVLFGDTSKGVDHLDLRP